MVYGKTHIKELNEGFRIFLVLVPDYTRLSCGTAFVVLIKNILFLALFFIYIVPGKTAYEIDRGSCWFTNNSLTHALKPVLFIYCKERINLQYLNLDQRY